MFNKNWISATVNESNIQIKVIITNQFNHNHNKFNHHKVISLCTCRPVSNYELLILYIISMMKKYEILWTSSAIVVRFKVDLTLHRDAYFTYDLIYWDHISPIRTSIWNQIDLNSFYHQILWLCNWNCNPF